MLNFNKVLKNDNQDKDTFFNTLKGTIFLLAVILFPNCYGGAESITDVMIEEINNKNSGISIYTANYQEFITKENKRKMITGKIAWKGEDRGFMQEITPKEEEIVVIYDSKFRYVKGIDKNKDIIYKANYKNLIKEFGYIAKMYLPYDIREPFSLIKPDTLNYIGIEKTDIENKRCLTYKFEGKYRYISSESGELTMSKAWIFIDLDTGLLRKLLIFNEGANVLLKRVIVDIKINSIIPDSRFECELREGEQIVNSTDYYKNLFTTLSSKD